MKHLVLILYLLCSSNIFAQEINEKYHGPKTGIKGFIESGYTIGVGKNHEGRISLLATVGYQFNPYLFIGFGSGENYFHDSKHYGIPIYGAIRANLLKTWVTPYIDAKIGTSIADVKGFFFRPSIGCRFGAQNNTAFTLSIGYEYQDLRDSDVSLGGIAIKAGFDF